MVDIESMAKKDEKRDLISFKVAEEIYREIEQYAKNQKDEAGYPLSVSQAARRLMLEALRKLKK